MQTASNYDLIMQVNCAPLTVYKREEICTKSPSTRVSKGVLCQKSDNEFLLIFEVQSLISA